MHEDVRQSCHEFEAALVKGKAWLNSLQWVTVGNRFKAMASALAKLQVRSLHACDCVPTSI